VASGRIGEKGYATNAFVWESFVLNKPVISKGYKIIIFARSLKGPVL
jgi:hypothetical protein